MRRKQKKLLGVVLLLAIMLSLVLLPEKELKADTTTEYGTLVESGTCGATDTDTVGWAIYDSGADNDENTNTGDTLVFSGSGEMEDYAYAHNVPWKNYRLTITKVVFVQDSQITSIGESAFSYCSALTEITLPNSVTSIGESAFYECEKLTEIVLTDSVTSIGESAFSYCSTLTEIMLPNSVTSIGAYAFSDCSALTEIEISNSVTSIGTYAFFDCSALTEIEIPANVQTIGTEAFSGCTQLVFNVADSNGNYCAENGALYNKEKSKLIAYPTASGDIILPESVVYIDGSAFYENTQLTDIVLPEGLKSIGRFAFGRCSNLKAIDLPQNLTEIGSYAFYSCTSISSVTIPEGVAEISELVFACCSNLTEITLPSSITSIGFNAFSDCVKLTSIAIPEGVTSIGNNAFENCEELKEIYYPSGLNVTNASISENAIQASYVEAENNTIKLMIESLPAETTTVTLPSDIYGKVISSIEYAEGIDVEIECTHHYPATGQWESNQEEHWFTGCSICGLDEEVREAHEFQNGIHACRCGYVPFTILEQSEDMQLIYANYDNKSVSVVVTPAYETLTITYQWYENDVAITGATSNVYVIPQNKKPGNYTYTCKMTCGTYHTSTDIEVEVTKIALPSVVPQSTISVDNKTKLVSAVSLPSNWAWSTADSAKTIPAGGKLTVTANYVGDDKDYYVTVTKTITITRAACVSSHVLYDGNGEKAPTCTSEGIGHKECTVCGDILESNIKVAKVNHTLIKVAKVAATTTKTGMEAHYRCSVCGKLFSDANGKNEVTKASLTIPVIVEEKVPEKDAVEKKAPAKGTIIKDKNGNKYKVTKSSTKNGTVSFVAPGKKKASTVKIPKTVKINGITYKVTAIEKNAFKNNKYIKKLVIGDNVTTIGANAFYGCTKLKTVTLGKNVATISSKAFYKCTSLTTITLPSKVKKISTSAFHGCKKLKTITIKTKLLKSSNIGKNAFKGISSKATIKLPKSKYKTYKTMLCKKGISKKAKFKKA